MKGVGHAAHGRDEKCTYNFVLKRKWYLGKGFIIEGRGMYSLISPSRGEAPLIQAEKQSRTTLDAEFPNLLFFCLKTALSPAKILEVSDAKLQVHYDKFFVYLTTTLQLHR
jgi:hypothetical protein